MWVDSGTQGKQKRTGAPQEMRKVRDSLPEVEKKERKNCSFLKSGADHTGLLVSFSPCLKQESVRAACILAH